MSFHLFQVEVINIINIKNNTNLDEKLEGDENFRAWKYRIMLILQENDLHKFMKEEVKEPEEAEAKSKHKKCHMPQFEKQFNVIEEHYVIFYDKVCN